MSTAVAEPPVKTAAQTASELPDLTAAFKAELTKVKAGEAPAVEPVKTETVKAEPAKTVEPAKTEPVETEPTKAADPAKKRSALDAALADDAPVVEPVKDEVAQLLESTNPNWDKARETMKRQSEELKTFRESTTKAAQPPPELTAKLTAQEKRVRELEAENSKMRDSIMALDVRFDPVVQEKLQGRDTSVQRVAQQIKDAGGDADAFLQAMDLPLAKRGKFLDAILDSIESQHSKGVITRKLADIDVLDESLDEQLSKPTKSFEDLKRSREVAAREQAEKIEAFKTATYEKVSRELPKLSKFMRLAPDDAEGAQEYNAQLKADMERAPKLLSVDPEEATRLTFKAARYDSLEKIATERFAKDSTRIAELEATLAKFEGAEPGFRGNGKAPVKQDYERPIADVFNEALQKPQI